MRKSLSDDVGVLGAKYSNMWWLLKHLDQNLVWRTSSQLMKMGEKNDRVYYRTMYLHEANSFFVKDKPDISLSFSVFTKIKSKMSFWEGYTIRSMKVWNSPKTSFSNWLSQKLVIMIIFGPGTFVKIYFHQAVAQEHVRTVSMAKICFPIPNNDINYQQWLSDENCICCCISKSCEAIELYQLALKHFPNFQHNEKRKTC